MNHFLCCFASVNAHKFINVHGNKLHYIDTEGFDSEHIYHDIYYGKILGELKHEYTAAAAIFLTPKLYAAQVIDNTTGKSTDIISSLRRANKYLLGASNSRLEWLSYKIVLHHIVVQVEY